MRSTAYRGVYVEAETENGYVVETGSRAYFVPLEDREEAIEAARDAQSVNRSNWSDWDSIPPGTVENSTGRDREERALLWSRIQSRAGPSYEDLPLEFPGPAEVASRARDETVPVPIALEGKEVLAGYLSAIGHSDMGISHSLDVSESTVRQYLSNVRNGGR
jgi:DNA-binding NarL/FixJ family response regulator